MRPYSKWLSEKAGADLRAGRASTVNASNPRRKASPTGATAIDQPGRGNDIWLDMDIELAVCQLVGPLLFAWMIGLRFIDHQDCLGIVDDFLIAHRLDETAGTPPDT
jgi:hypothetical protein